MRWRWVWLRSRMTACAVSAVISLIAAGLAPIVMVGLLAGGIAAVVGWHSGLVLWCCYGARVARSDDATVVFRALVPLAALRGRNQPRLYVNGRPDSDVRAADERTLVVSRRLVGWIRDGRIADLAVCDLVVRALALAPVQRSRLVAAVRLFCLPWMVLAALGRPVSGVARRLRPLVWLFALMAGCDLYRRGEWVAIVLLVLAVVATVTTPRFDRAWAARRHAITEDAVRRHLPRQAADPIRSSTGVTFVAPPMPTREGGS